MLKGNRLTALFFILFSLFVCQQSTVIGLGTLRHPGPGLLAFGAGASVGVLALVLLIRSMISPEGQAEAADRGRTLRKGRFLLICLSLFIYTAVVNRLGFLLSTFAFVLFILRMIETERWWRTVIKSILITIGNYLIFVVWLGLSLPKGFLDW